LYFSLLAGKSNLALIRETYAGKPHPRVAAGLAPLLNLQLCALEATDLDRRIAKVEKLLAGGEGKSGRKGYDETGKTDYQSQQIGDT